MEYNLSMFQKGLEELHISLSREQMNQFLTYYEMLVEKNKVMNLTAITEFDEVIEKHFLDSLSLVRIFRPEGKYFVIDLGTGAGFPGIPLKISFPDLNITLADSLLKRVGFLQEVIDALKLQKICAIHGRAEDLGHHAAYREQFDLCVSRAVANLSTLSEYCLPFVNIGGAFISYKSGEIEQEVENAKKGIYILGGRVDEVSKFELGENKRSFVVIKKEKHTPKKYSRKAGVPSKMPL